MVDISYAGHDPTGYVRAVAKDQYIKESQTATETAALRERAALQLRVPAVAGGDRQGVALRAALQRCDHK